jgi:hypothetical protein
VEKAMAAAGSPDVITNPASPAPPRRLRQYRKYRAARFVGPLLLYLLVGLGILRPFRGSAFRGAGDLSMAMTMIAEARDALREGQFPVRVSPHLHEGARYPLFQYYGNFPYTVTGFLCSFPGVGPFLAWKIVALASLIAGGFFVLRLAYLLSRNFPASVLAGVLFQVSPYLLTDLYARGAFTEFTAFNLLPAAFYFTFCCFRLPRARYIVACAVTWSLIAFTHNITYLYGVLFATLLFLGYWRTPRLLPRLFRLALAGALHAMLIVWYVVPQFRTVEFLRIQYSANPFNYHGLTPLRILLAPELTNTFEGGTTTNLGLQVGFPIVCCVLFSLAALIGGRGRRSVRKSILRLIVLFAIAFFLAWSPFDFWQYLPRVLWFVQFPYRLLMFVVLFGTLLGAGAVAAYFGNRLPGTAALIFLAVLGFFTASFIPPHQGPIESLDDNMESALHGPGFNDYLPKLEYLAAANLTDADPENNEWETRITAMGAAPAHAGAPAAIAIRKRDIKLGENQTIKVTLYHPAIVELPVLYYPRLLEVSDNGRRIAYGNSGQYLALRLKPGTHRIAIRFVGVRWANAISSIGWTGIVVGIALLALGRLIRMRKVRRWIAASRLTPVGPMTAVAGFAVLVLFVGLSFWRPLDQTLVIKATASSTADNQYLPQYAFDGNPDTAWAAQGGGPAVLTARFSHPARLHGMILLPRITTLYEGWRELRVVAFEHKKQVYAGDFDFSQAAPQPLAVAKFPSIRADQIELHFSDPVTQRIDGTTAPADMLSPGYREIEFLWDPAP